ncbi:MAG: biotin--[acetyl-CoA-carboxylase] ligase [Lachnospiraceae bacterium]|nr:biotin--[acetyl-CoA-carboxylase] ligase [Lachnospiraceae bacterium]
MVTDGKRTIDKVLSFLENNRGGFISGADMAENIGISRNAVWKAINELKQKGYEIESVTNKGYRLTDKNDIISAEGIRAYMTPELTGNTGELIVFESVDSTNDKAKQLALKGAKHGTCVVAVRQDGGRGRKDHRFYSPEGGIYMSVILKPEMLSFKKSDIITAHIGSCVCDAIEALTNISPVIRGINDLYIKDRKICGILIESGSEFDSGTLQWIVAGIGINFDSDIKRFPKELSKKAASLFSPGKAPISKNCLIAQILMRICDTKGISEKSVLSEYNKRKE